MVTQRSSGGPVFFSYTLRGGDRETWTPRFSYSGFRYVQVDATAPEHEARLPLVHNVEGEFLYLDAARVGHFSCSNELFNRIHALVDAAIRSNLQHVVTDCPHREKLGWLEVPYLMGPSLLYGWDLRAFLPKIERDIRDTQTVGGLFQDVAPMYGAYPGAFQDSPEWGSAGVFVPWLAWEWYGDREPLEDSYRAMTDYAHYLASRAKNHLILYGLGDWYDIGPGEPGPSKLTPKGLTATATYIEDLRVLEHAAEILDHDSEARGFAAEGGLARAAFQKAYYRSEQPIYAEGSQTALAMPLALGLAPQSARTALVERLVAEVHRRGDHPTSGDIGYRYLLRALLDAGHSDVIFDMTNRNDSPSYGAQLAAGATSLTEAWDADPESSQNHCMLGHIEEWFYAGLAGIRPDLESPGLRRVGIHPEFVGDLKAVTASWETLRGTVGVRWRIEGESLDVAVDIPPGITAEVSLPAPADQAITDAGLPWAKVSGLRMLRREQGRVVFEVQSGYYDFQVAGFQSQQR
jgi:hypothetical protein